MRRDRGFSLLELGIVIAIGAIFMAAAAATATSFYRTARSARTGNELAGLATAGANALKRLLQINVAPGASGPNYSYNLFGVGPITATAPQCYDLHTGNCSTTNAAGPAAFVPAGYSNLLPVSATLISMMTANNASIYNNGYNAWCEPYVICLYPARADVLTCIPTADLNSAGLESAAGCGVCGNTNPVTLEATSCVMESAPAFTKSGSNFSYAYSDYTYLLGGGSTLPGSFGQGQAAPCSPGNCK